MTSTEVSWAQTTSTTSVLLPDIRSPSRPHSDCSATVSCWNEPRRIVETLNTGFLPVEVSSVRQFTFEQAQLQGPSASQLESKRLVQLNDVSDKLFFWVIYLCAGPSSPCRKQGQGSPMFLRPCMRLQISSLQSLIMISQDVHVLRIRLSIFDKTGVPVRKPSEHQTRSIHLPRPLDPLTARHANPAVAVCCRQHIVHTFYKQKGQQRFSPNVQPGPGHP